MEKISFEELLQKHQQLLLKYFSQDKKVFYPISCTEKEYVILKERFFKEWDNIISVSGWNEEDYFKILEEKVSKTLKGIVDRVGEMMEKNDNFMNFSDFNKNENDDLFPTPSYNIPKEDKTNRKEIIKESDISDLSILLNSSNSVDDFLSKI